MRRLTLTQRLSLVFVVLLTGYGAVSAWLQIHASTRHEQEVLQRVSFGLAGHIAGTAQLMDAGGWRPQAVRTLFDQLMAVNPAVEVYLLDNDGRIVGDAAPPGHLKRDRVDLAPIRTFLSGGRMPIFGDDPRGTNGRKPFSVAPVRMDGRDVGFVYVVLQGEAYDAIARARSADRVLQLSLWTLGGAALLALAMGLVAFRSITQPLRALTRAVRDFDADGEQAAALADARIPAARGDDIAVLRDAFVQMGRRLAEQWRELASQDQRRRDLVANISHDLRTPLTSLHGYLETLRIKEDTLDAAQRRRYLDIALDQSRKVRHLAQELFELARLESGLVKPEPESFALPDLVQDVVQKCELAAQARQQRIHVEVSQRLPAIRADLSMVERILTNLLDNAIHHNPQGTSIRLRLARAAPDVVVDVIDDGEGIPAGQRQSLFERAPALSRISGNGGLGLIVVRRLLQLNQGDIQYVETEAGTTFRFWLPAA